MRSLNTNKSIMEPNILILSGPEILQPTGGMSSINCGTALPGHDAPDTVDFFEGQ